MPSSILGTYLYPFFLMIYGCGPCRIPSLCHTDSSTQFMLKLSTLCHKEQDYFWLRWGKGKHKNEFNAWPFEWPSSYCVGLESQGSQVRFPNNNAKIYFCPLRGVLLSGEHTRAALNLQAIQWNPSPYIKTLKCKSQAAIASILFNGYELKYQTVRFLNRFLI